MIREAGDHEHRHIKDGVKEGGDPFREQAIRNLGFDDHMEEVSLRADLLEQLEGETVDLKVKDLLYREDEDHPVYIKRTNGSFEKLRYSKEARGGYEVHYGRGIHKVVSGEEILSWQDEVREWISERSKERDRKRDAVHELLLKSVREATAELKSIGATKIKQTQKEGKSYRYGDFGEYEMYLRKIVRLAFSINGKKYQLSGITATGYDRDIGTDEFFAEWLIFREDNEVLKDLELQNDAIASLKQAGLLK